MSILTTEAALAISDKERAIIAATDLFWHKGFDETSVEDLVQATGFNRYAIYNQFGGKKEMLLAALEHFFRSRKDRYAALLDDETMKPVQVLRHMFSGFIDDVVDSGNGCLMCNTFTELAPNDAQIQSVCQAYQAEMTAFFALVLTRAIEAGDVAKRHDPAALAELFMSMTVATGLRAKMGEPRGVLLATAETMIDVISE